MQSSSPPESSPGLVFTAHARKRMRQRNISEVAVQQVIAYPIRRAPRVDGRTEYIGRYQGRMVEVVVDERANPREVVTVYPLEEGGRS